MKNMWRITDDFWDRWDLLLNMFDRCELWQNHVSAGSYPDCDMLPLGKIGKGFAEERDTAFTREEQITMVTLWCMFGSPLMIGAELTKLDEWTLSLLTRKEILKLVSSEYTGRQFVKEKEYAIWSCLNEKNGEQYVALFNFLDEAQEIACRISEIEQFAESSWKELYQNDDEQTKSGIREQAALELWTGKKMQIQDLHIADLVPAHGARLFRLK